MALAPAKWVKLDQNGEGPGARSSHAITIVGQKAYIFGGEHTPRVPIDNNLFVFDLTDLIWSVAEATGDVPPPRVGVTMAAVGETIYVFGGRDATHTQLNELYAFDTSKSEWTLVSSGDVGPPHRSYHSTAADDRRVYVFGGCGPMDRRNDLWAYDVVDKKWVEFPVPGENCKPRGGAGLVVAQGKIWVVYGFSGFELDDIHFFEPANEKWVEVETTGKKKPTPRSVFSNFASGKYIFVFGGEIGPSDSGHLGAGMFSDELYALDTETLVWEQVKDLSNSVERPSPRGWCAFASGRRNGQSGLLVYGGISGSNDRLGDIFFLAVA